MFRSDTYAQRRAHLREHMDSGLVLFVGNELSPMNYAANPYPFRQDASMLYYWGLDEPGLVAVLDVDEGRDVVFGAESTMDDVVWMGPRPSLQERAEMAGAAGAGTMDDLTDMLAEAKEHARAIHYLPPYRDAQRLRLGAWLALSPAEVDAHASRRLSEAVVEQRSVKSSDEVAEIERSLGIARDMHVLAMQLTRPGATEREVDGAVRGVAMAQGRGVSFQPIYSVHGEVLHNEPTDHALEDGELALHDAGAVSWNHYASDVTRVTPVSGTFDERQSTLYEVVLDVQEEAIRAVRPGVRYRDIHLLAARHLTHRLKELGLMQGDVEEAVAEGAHALFFPHGLGHMLGLDVHDMESIGEDLVGYGGEVERSEQFGLNFLRLARTLRPGFVLTVEPGIYFIPPLIDEWRAEGRHQAFIDYDAVDEYRDFGGIRLEDDVVVTDDGHRVLGPHIPKTIDEVEEMAGA